MFEVFLLLSEKQKQDKNTNSYKMCLVLILEISPVTLREKKKEIKNAKSEMKKKIRWSSFVGSL